MGFSVTLLVCTQPSGQLHSTLAYYPRTRYVIPSYLGKKTDIHEHNKSRSAVEVPSQGAEEAWTMK